ncbi:MAG: PaaI family thioesterase [Erythrobacteraceae bacterium]|jgi:acyl-coenzyme A thioesterase PaaI-like protein|nr:PaaI family thioesterase [Erythrobacteraceae bacterium]
MADTPASLDLPAYARSLGITIIGEDGGMPLVTVEFGSTVEGRPGHFHGGATAGLLEAAGYAALRTALLAAGRDPQLKPINITVQYLAAGKSRPTFALGRITRLGRRNANIAVEAWQDDRERPIATAVMNILMV